MQMQNVVNYTVVDIQDSQPEGRLFHTFTQVQNGEAILLGGIKGPFQSYTFCDEIFVFNAILTQWTKLQLDSVLSEQITPRYGHAAAYLKINKILIFGGLTIDETIEPSKKEILTQNELYQLQYESKTSEYFWKTQVCVGEKPEKRTGASLSVVRRHVVLYGGNNLKNSFNDCWTLNLLNLNENNQVAWSRVDFTERVPPGRYAHTCVSISNDDIYDNIIIFGGKDETILNDFFTLKFINHKNQWLLTAHNVKNPMQHRVYHNTVSFGSCFINIGGRINNKDLSMTIEIFSVKSGKYLPLKVPYGINKFSSIIFNQQIYTFGGLSLNNPELPINDILQIDITEPLEFVLNFDITAPKERSSIHSDKKNSNEKPKDGKIIEEKITNISSNISTAPTQPGTPNSLAPPSSTAPSHANSPYSMNNLQLKIDSNQKIQKEEEQSFKIADFDTNFEKDRQMEEEIDLGALGGQLILQKSFSHQVEVGKSIEFLKDSPPVSPITEGISLQELEQMKFFEDPRATHNIILNEMLKPEEFRKKELDFTFSVRAISNLIAQADYLVQSEPTILQLSGPFKIFGDIHGQYNDLMRMFFYHGSPFSNGKNDDINKFSYLFLGDYVDRGKNSVEVMVLLLSLKIRYPKRVFLLRGNHEDRCINTVQIRNILPDNLC